MSDASAGGWRVGRETSATGPVSRGSSVGSAEERGGCVRNAAENIPGRIMRNDDGAAAASGEVDASPVGTRIAAISRRSFVNCATEKFAWLRRRWTEDGDARSEAYCACRCVFRAVYVRGGAPASIAAVDRDGLAGACVA